MVVYDCITDLRDKLWKSHRGAPGSVPTSRDRGTVYVVDGDTIDAQLGETIQRVRYIGMNTPE